MKSIYEVMKEIHGNKFDVIVRDDGIRIYRSWQLSSICEYGKIVALGIRYNKQITMVTPNDMEIIDVTNMSDDEYDDMYFIENPEKWETTVGVKAVDLIGLSSNEFYNEVTKRLRKVKKEI